VNSVPAQRLSGVDGLRGLAIVMVVVGHLFGFLGNDDAVLIHGINALNLRMLVFNEHDAVLIFFVLSGFVMYLPFRAAARQVAVVGFWVQRFFRLYPLYILNVFFCVLVARYAFDHASLVAFSPSIADTVTTFWPGEFSAGYVWQHVGVLSLTHSTINGVLWTLFVEYKMSLLFPLMIVLVKRSRAAVSLSAAALLALWFGLYDNAHVHYAPLFLLGAWAAQYYDRLPLPPARWHAPCMLALLAVFPARYVLRAVGLEWGYVCDLATAVATVGLLVLAARSERISAWFSGRTLVALGTMTYPIYLFHFPLWLASLSFFNAQDWSRPVVWMAAVAATLVATLALSYGLHKMVEIPCTKLGKRCLSAFRQPAVRASE
jgi:peptidoglycan/LPS O-acetylase OafA/YrhL